MSMALVRATWNDFARHVAWEETGRDILEDEAEFLLWERTAWPMTHDLDHIERQIREALRG